MFSIASEISAVSQLRVKALGGPEFGPIDLDVDQGQCVCLSGPSGAGKTMLMRSIVDLDDHQGEVWVNGQTASSMSGPCWRKQVGFLPAHSHWWFETVAEHLSEVEPASLGALGFENDILDKPVTRLSTGEQQRLALIRLLANKPTVLLLDEPTASLDRENVARIESLVKQYRQQHNVAVLWVSHDQDQIKRVATRQLTIEQGQLTGEQSW